jgi:hypothetical protein
MYDMYIEGRRRVSKEGSKSKKEGITKQSGIKRGGHFVCFDHCSSIMLWVLAAEPKHHFVVVPTGYVIPVLLV